ncbi:uncharacterized protein LOC111869506 [Cryptotermes secundus]|uniref:uncharacterized protein LOC111869506 n=1 Tax=Cryptotermes secundus TaxID=105785 RepID=UPI000CD7C18E|nr:uncharacterized protein LOC111869506 [Cryptotermes secundus]
MSPTWVRDSHHQHHALPVHSAPPSTRHSSAVNSAGTSTASELQQALPWLTPDFKALVTQLGPLSSSNMHVDLQWIADNFAPDQFRVPETPGQFGERLGIPHLPRARETEYYEASYIPVELPVSEERPPIILTDAEIERELSNR